MVRWYVLHTLSGHEEKVKTFLEVLIQERDMGDKILKVLIPTEDIIQMKGGKKKTVIRKFFPGYLLIQVDLTPEVQSIINGIPGVTHFITSKNKPVPLQDEEVEKILHRVEGLKEERKIEVPFKKGDPAKVIDGPFKDFSGIIDEVNEERGKVKIMVSIFGRLTPVEVDFFQIQEDKG
ncbi:transcription termination/antitermination factor NusG [bacterium]|nr:transcription termination/antitermination factor NusG [bacterium]